VEELPGSGRSSEPLISSRDGIFSRGLGGLAGGFLGAGGAEGGAPSSASSGERGAPGLVRADAAAVAGGSFGGLLDGRGGRLDGIFGTPTRVLGACSPGPACRSPLWSFSWVTGPRHDTPKGAGAPATLGGALDALRRASERGAVHSGRARLQQRGFAGVEGGSGGRHIVHQQHLSSADLLLEPPAPNREGPFHVRHPRRPIESGLLPCLARPREDPWRERHP
jgi:hypothetical protein